MDKEKIKNIGKSVGIAVLVVIGGIGVIAAGTKLGLEAATCSYNLTLSDDGLKRVGSAVSAAINELK